MPLRATVRIAPQSCANFHAISGPPSILFDGAPPACVLALPRLSVNAVSAQLGAHCRQCDCPGLREGRSIDR